MKTGILALAVAAAFIGVVKAECPNACSGHGDCAQYDMCTCWRNWQGNDCSERICPFGLAHVDTPKGDLNHDNTVSTTAGIVAKHPAYWYGTEEKFPAMVNEASAGTNTALTHTAHYYMECSNKGICDRDSGECECFTAYEGSACQRASCPNSCSGHGTCESIRELAEKDYENIYELWDRDVTYGCKCDPGYYGADCSSRYCKYGVDPLYYDDEPTPRYNTWRLWIQPTNDGSGTYSAMTGTYAIKFYDVFDEDFVTDPINVADDLTAHAADTSSTVYSALTGLPNTVIESMTIVHTYDATAKDIFYTLTFTSNPGKAKSPEVMLYLDGVGTTSLTKGALANGGSTYLYPGDISGEFRDYFYERCEGVEVTVTNMASAGGDDDLNYGKSATLTALSTTAAQGGSELDKLKACLGDSNGETSDNVEIYDWDTGASSFTTGGTATASATFGEYPHAIKLVEVGATDTKGGVFYITYWDSVGSTFNLLSKLSTQDGATSASTSFYVYTTDAVVKLVYMAAQNQPYTYPTIANYGYSATYDGTNNAQTPIYAYWTQFSDTIYTSYDASCENQHTVSGKHVFPCLQKGDYIFLPDGCWGETHIYAATPAATQNSNTPGLPTASRAFHSNTILQTGGAASASDYTGHMYEIKKIWVHNFGASTATTEDRYRIKLDKAIPWNGSKKFETANTAPDASSFLVNTATAGKFGVNPIFKFDVSTNMDGNTASYYEYVSECSNKGSCDSELGLCECFTGYTKLDCGTQNSFAS